jgi:hypothetical protein
MSSPIARNVLAVALCGVCTVARGAVGQNAPAIARVEGIAFDSLHGKPLAGAFIAIAGGDWTTTSDANGRFYFERVPPGPHALIVHHALLDTLGLAGLSVRVVVRDDRAPLRVAVPSFATMWRNVCGDRPAPADSGFVYGVVRDAMSNRVVDSADISVVWHDSIAMRGPPGANGPPKVAEARSSSLNVPENRSRVAPVVIREPSVGSQSLVYVVSDWGLQRRTDANGIYAVCGIPVRAFGFRVAASTDSTASDSVVVTMDPRVSRRDLRVGRVGPMAALHQGTIVGQLTDNVGAPFRYARVIVADVADVRSDERGEFVIRGVGPGTRQVEVRYIGMTAAFATVDVVAGDTAKIALQLDRVPRLPGMSVTAPGLGRVIAAEFNARQRAGLGYVIDSTVAARAQSTVGMLRQVPGLVVEQRGATPSARLPDGHGGTCAPTVWLDGVEASLGNLLDVTPAEVGGLEVYTRPLTVPTAFMQPGVQRPCGAILVWTKYVFRNR